ncbi:hypothetical protein CYMTET_25983 [Cymbomonas tetramitiformis]|uniref:Transmembrane protein n=1 Tax=Cymbomonas tetramitiformis TaxID=36881 RepID=A0AAE0KYP3_9CHLO|nr:hypothetical protein CYMTET_25983 [Cymbomonas tetramitiformis]
MSRAVTRRNYATAVGLVAFVASCGLFPLFLGFNTPDHMKLDYNGSLDKQRQIRGQYVNTGSKDIGPDTTVYK